ncbi:MAG TPA: GtrA family protein [Caulobacteraceae bacterium]|jgi:putative flippase GtrA|nr:GtrA family protein [Caulobacteraceae bacterium]
MKLPTVVREINWFAAVGVAATAINYIGALTAQHLLRLEAIPAGVVGYGAAVGVSYFGNSLLTFRRPALHGRQFARFAVISLAGLAINLGMVFVGAHTLGWPLWRALIPVVIVVPASTFVMSKFWAFKEMEAAG